MRVVARRAREGGMNETEREHEVIASVCRARLGREPFDPALWDALGAVLARHERQVFRMCLRVVRREEDAEDLTQRTLETALEQLDGFEGRSSVGTWLCGIARFLCFNHVRKRGDLLTEDGIVDEADADASVLRSLARRERDAALMAVAESCLDSVEREAVRLRYVEQLPYSAIEGLLELDTKSGARGLLQACKRKLKPAMKAKLREMGVGSTTFLRSAP